MANAPAGQLRDQVGVTGACMHACARAHPMLQCCAMRRVLATSASAACRPSSSCSTAALTDSQTFGACMSCARMCAHVLACVHGLAQHALRAQPPPHPTHIHLHACLRRAARRSTAHARMQAHPAPSSLELAAPLYKQRLAEAPKSKAARLAWLSLALALARCAGRPSRR